MSGLLSTIRAQLQQVPGLLGDNGYAYRTRTSAPGVDTKTWSAWVALEALLTNKAIGIEHDDRTSSDKRIWRARIRVSDAIVLGPNCQIRDSDGATIWSVGGAPGMSAVLSSGPGTIAWAIYREDTAQVGANRQAGG